MNQAPPSLPATSGAYADGAQLPKTVKVARLNHSFGEGEQRAQALFDNNLEVRRGEIVIMTGPSGSGKTTLLTLIGSLRTVQEGSLKVLGSELFGATRDQIVKLRREMGFIFQAHNLFESLTAYQNVNMAAELLGMNRASARERIEYLLTRLDLGHRIHYKPNSLVLADEPTAALDEKTGREVVTLFQEMAQDEGVTVIMVTHDNRILDVADRIVNMVQGHIKSDVAVVETSVICEFLRQFPLFAELTPTTLTDMADKMMVQHAEPGDVVIRQGDAGDLFYLIRTGQVEVVVEEGGKKKTVAELGEGQYFGEAALINDKPRNATVIAIDKCTFYTLGQHDFKAVLTTSKSFEAELRDVLASRT